MLEHSIRDWNADHDTLECAFVRLMSGDCPSVYTATTEIWSDSSVSLVVLARHFLPHNVSSSFLVCTVTLGWIHSAFLVAGLHHFLNQE